MFSSRYQPWHYPGLDAFGTQGLPYLYMAFAVISSFFSLVYLQISRRLPFTYLLVINPTFILVGTLAIRFALHQTDADWILFILPVWFEVVVTIGGIGFLTMMNRLFDVRQGKRLIGIARLTVWLANIGGGFLIPTLVVRIGTINLFVVSAISIVIAMGVLFSIVRRYRDVLLFHEEPTQDESDAVEERHHFSGQELFSRLVRSRYVILIFSLIGIWWVAFYFVDNIFLGFVNEQYPDADQLSTFLGLFFGVVQGTVLLLGNLFTGTMLNHYGMRFVGLVMPVIVTAFAGILALTESLLAVPVVVSFLLVAGSKLANGGLGFSIDINARTLLYQPLPPDERVRTQTIGQGIVEPLAKGFAGLILLYLTVELNLGVTALLYIFLIIAILWIFVTTLTFGEYPHALQQAITKRHIITKTLEIVDEGSAGVLLRNLKNPYPEAVIYVLNLLEEIRPEAVEDALPDLVVHPSPEVRQEALRRIESLDVASLSDQVSQQILNDPTPQVREVALSTLVALSHDRQDKDVVLALVLSHLNDPDPIIRRGAMIGLLRHSAGQSVEFATQKLITLAQSPITSDRVVAAEVIGKVGGNSFYTILNSLLHDPDPPVRRAAVVAAGHLRSPRLWTEIMAALEDVEVRIVAAQALVLIGDIVVPEIQAAFNQPRQSKDLQIRLLRICGRIKGQRVTKFLQDKISFPDAKVRTRLLAALSICGYHVAFEKNKSNHHAIFDQIKYEVEYALHILVIQVDLGVLEQVELLIEALDHLVEEARERIFFLFSFLYDDRSILSARDALRFGTSAQQAYALEVLDTILPQDMKIYILPLLDTQMTRKQRLQALTALFPYQRRTRKQRLQQIVVGLEAGEDTWTRICALYSIAQLGDKSFADIVIPTTQSPDPLVRETALWTLDRIDADAYGKIIAALGYSHDYHGGTMYSVIEKVIILKTISIFAETPTDVLVDVANILGEVEVPAGQAIIEKGDLGHSMYVIVSGKVHVHDGDLTLNYLGERDVFGELALLDPEPRIATVTTLEDTLLFRLDQEPFYELIADRGEVARGIMRVLVRYLRTSVRDLAELRDQMNS